MALIISCFAVHVFVVVYILINTAYGGYKEDAFKEKECLEQILNKFGNCTTAPQCLQYAITHYVYDVNTANSNTHNQGFAGQSSGQSIVQEGSNIYAELSDEHIFEGLEDQLNFEGLRDFIEADSYIADQGSFGQPSGEYEDPESTDILNSAKQYLHRLPTIDNGTDYATQYHRIMYETFEVIGVLKREDYCHEISRLINSEHNDLDCMNALTHFGVTQISALKWAFSRHTLAECQFLQSYLPEYKYITGYMLHLSSESIRIRPSRRPSKFCKDFVRGTIYVQRN